MILNNPNYMVTIKQVVDPTKPNEPGPCVVAPLSDSLSYDSSSEYTTPYAQGLFGGGGSTSTSTASRIAAVGGKIIQGAAPLMGIRLTAQALTAQIWQGSSESVLNLEIDFAAESDPDLEVRTPLLTLLKMSTASVDAATGMLKSPGPNIDLRDAGRIAIGGAITTRDAVVGVGERTGIINSENANLNGKSMSNKPPAKVGGLGGAQFWKSVVRNQISIQIGTYAYFDSVVILNVQKTYSHQLDALTGLPMYAKASIQFKPLFMVTQTDLDEIFALRDNRTEEQRQFLNL